MDIPLLCLQCNESICMMVCHVKALSKDPKTSAIVIDYDVCAGCKMCAMACPFGGISIDQKGKPIKCDLCGGEPICAEFCPTGAITHMGTARANLAKMRASLEKFSYYLRKG